MRIRFVVTICALALVLGHAQEQRTTTRDQFLADVMAANPGAIAAHAGVDQARADVRRAASWEAPMVTATLMDTPLSDLDPFTGSADRRFNLQQRIPFPGKKGFEEDLSRAGVARATADDRAVRLSLRTTALILFARARGGSEQIRLLEEQQALLRQMIRSVESRYAVGQASQADLLRMRIELEELQNLTSGLRYDVRSTLFRMNELRGREPEADFGVLVEPEAVLPSLGPDSLAIIGIRQRPDIQQAQAMRAAQEASLSLARRSYWPDLNVGLGYRNNLAMGKSWELMLGISLPIAPWSSGAVSGSSEAAEAGIRAAEATITDRTNAARQETASWYEAARVRAERYERYVNRIVPDARQSLGVLQTAYQTGSTDFLSFIDSFRRLESHLVDMIEERIALQTALAYLDQAAGRGLEPRSEEAPQ